MCDKCFSWEMSKFLLHSFNIFLKIELKYLILKFFKFKTSFFPIKKKNAI